MIGGEVWNHDNKMKYHGSSSNSICYTIGRSLYLDGNQKYDLYAKFSFLVE